MKKLETFHSIFPIALASIVPYTPCLFGDFVFDDRPALLKNEDVYNSTGSLIDIFHHDFWGGNLSAKSSHKSYRPLTTLIFRLAASAFGLVPWPFHLLNGLLHCLNSIMVWKVVQTFTKSKTVRFLTAMIFAMHPVHTEAICAIVGLADLLWSFFALIAISHNDNPILVILCSFLSLSSKEQGIMIIPIILALKLKKKNIWSLKYLILLYALFEGLFLYLRLKLMDFSPPKFQEGDNPIGFMPSFIQRTLNFHYLIVLNFWLLICPQWLCYDWAMNCISFLKNPMDLRIVLILVFYVSLAKLCLKKRHWASLIFLILPFLPSSNLLVLVGFVVAERNLYLSILGFALLLSKAMKNMEARLPFLILIVLTFSLKSLDRSFQWQNEQKLFNSGLKICPNNAKVLYNVAKIATDEQIAKKYYEKALELWPKYEHAMNNLGNIYKNLRQWDQAEDLFHQALEISPTFAASWMNLGIVQSNLNKLDQAELSYLNALKWKRDIYPDCHFNLGNLYLKMQKESEAISAFEKCLEQNPLHFSAHTNLVILLGK